MALNFEIGDADKPRGHAILYFGSRGSEVLATYLLVLPIKMDMGKYLPPVIASQLGGMMGEMMGEGMGSFAAPPVPETVEGVEYLERLAQLRGDDLIAGGDVVFGDIAATMAETGDVVQEYGRLYKQYLESEPSATPDSSLRAPSDAGVQDVLYGLMSERDRLAELTRLVSTLRFAAERSDTGSAEEADASLLALVRLLPGHYWADKVREAAKDTSESGAQLAQLYVERCYKLLDEDFPAVEDLERRITAIGS